MAISQLNFFEMSVTAGLMIAAVLIFRGLFKRAPRWVFCLMWGIVALRLVVPFSIESRLSLLPEKETVFSSSVMGVIYDKDVNAQDVLSEQVPHEDTKTPSPGSDNQIIESGRPITVPGGDILNEQMQTGTEDITAPGENGLVSQISGSYSLKDMLNSALFVTWIVGIVFVMGYFAVSSISLKIKLNTATPLCKNIKQSEYIKSPFVLGIFSPKIYLPYEIDHSDMTYVLAHENAHIKRGDHITKIIAFTILSLHWFNPLVWIAYSAFCRDVELACDEKVVKKLDSDERRAYSTHCLIAVLKPDSLRGVP